MTVEEKRTPLRDSERLVDRFEERRRYLRAVAYRMLGSLSEADDALQEVWLRLSRSDRSDVENLREPPADQSRSERPEAEQLEPRGSINAPSRWLTC
jgi:DNA-directed RNA polymerase specialized sigma24 family protein